LQFSSGAANDAAAVKVEQEIKGTAAYRKKRGWPFHGVGTNHNDESSILITPCAIQQAILYSQARPRMYSWTGDAVNVEEQPDPVKIYDFGSGFGVPMRRLLSPISWALLHHLNST